MQSNLVTVPLLIAYYTTFDHPQQNSIQIELEINLLCHPLHSLLCHVRFMDTVPHTVLWIKTLLLHDNVQYKSVQKQSWHTGVLIDAAVKRETGCDAIK